LAAITDRFGRELFAGELIVNLLKLIFIIALISGQAFAFVGEISDEAFQDLKRETHQIYCSERNENEAVKSLWRDVDVFHCSSKRESEEFCECVSKASTAVPDKLINEQTKTIEDELRNKTIYNVRIANETENRDKLKHIFMYRNMVTNLGESCIAQELRHSPQKETQDLYYLDEKSLKANNHHFPTAIEIADFEQLQKMANTAHTYLLTTTSSTLYPSAEDRFRKIREIAKRVINNEFDKNLMALFPSEKVGANSCGQASKESVKMDMNVDVLYEYLNLRYLPTGEFKSDGELLEDAVMNVVRKECQKLNNQWSNGELSDYDKKREEEEVEKRLYNLSLGKGAFKLEGQLSGIRFNQISSLTSTGNEREIEELEIRMFHDIAYCKIRRKYKKIEDEVIESIKDGGQDFVEQNSELDNIDNEIEKYSDLVNDAKAEEKVLNQSLGDFESGIDPHVLGRLSHARERVSSGERKLAELQELRNTKANELDQKFGGMNNRAVFSASISTVEDLDKGVVTINNEKDLTVDLYGQVVKDNFDSEKSRVEQGRIFRALGKDAKNMVKNNMANELDETLELNNLIKSKDKEGLKEYFSKKKEDLSDLVTDVDRKKAEVSVEKVKENMLAKQKAGPEQLVTSSNDIKSVKSSLNTPLKSSSIKAKDSYKEKYEQAINAFAPAKKPSVKESIVRDRINRIVDQKEKVSKKLEEEAKELKAKETKFSKKINPLKSALDRTLKEVEKVSKEYEELEEKLESSVKQPVELPKASRANKQVLENSKKPERRAPVSQVSQPSKTSQVRSFEALSSGNQTNEEGSNSFVAQDASTFTNDSGIKLFNQELDSSSPVLTLSEFSKISDADLNIKVDSSGKVHDRIIVNTDNGKVILKAVYVDGKATKYEIIDSVNNKDVTKSLVQQKMEIIDQSSELFKYDEFLDLLNKAQ